MCFVYLINVCLGKRMIEGAKQFRAYDLFFRYVFFEHLNRNKVFVEVFRVNQRLKSQLVCRFYAHSLCVSLHFAFSSYQFDLNRNRRLCACIFLDLQLKLKLLILAERVGEECKWRSVTLLAVSTCLLSLCMCCVRSQVSFAAPWHFQCFILLLKLRGLIMCISRFDKCEPIVQIIMLDYQNCLPLWLDSFPFWLFSLLTSSSSSTTAATAAAITYSFASSAATGTNAREYWHYRTFKSKWIHRIRMGNSVIYSIVTARLSFQRVSTLKCRETNRNCYL